MATAGSEAYAPVDGGVVNVDTVAAVDELVARAAGARRVRIHVPSFTDGRVFSQVRALFESTTFDGVIEVHGDLLPDQVPLLERYGMVDVVLENGMDANDQPRHIRTAYRERRLQRGPAPRNEPESTDIEPLGRE